LAQPRRKPLLPPRFVDGHGNRVRQVEVRTPARIGMRNRASGANSASTSTGSPAVSEPNTSTSPGANETSYAERDADV